MPALFRGIETTPSYGVEEGVLLKPKIKMNDNKLVGGYDARYKLCYSSWNEEG